MPLHLAARMHALVHGLLETKDAAEAHALWREVMDLYEAHGLSVEAERATWLEAITTDVLNRLAIQPGHPLYRPIYEAVTRLIDDEGLLQPPEVDWSIKRSTTQWWEIRDALLAHKSWLTNLDQTGAWLHDQLVALLRPFQDALATGATTDTGDLTLSSGPLITRLSEPARAIDQMLEAVFSPQPAAAPLLFPQLARLLAANIQRTSAPSPLQDRPRPPLMPSQSGVKDPLALAGAYLAGTPLYGLARCETSLTIPLSARFEHCHILAGSGHGKTQTLQYLICQDLEPVARGERSIVVLDSQGDLIRNIAGLAEFAPGGPLHDRVVIIDPSDVEWPVSLNLFDVGIERLSGYAPLERERLTNSILELYDFVLGSLLAAEMTQKQAVIFRYVSRLMLHIPDATIHTLRELMEPGSEERFAPYIAELEGAARRFFETEFASREFEQTKRQVMRRLWGILENQTFERMFSHPRSKLDLYAELNAGKVVLINTAKDLLKEQGSEIFGRFFIALIAQAAQERATLPESQRLPTFVYIDEAADYFDRNIGTILAQARKYKVGMVLAHQYLGQLDTKLQDAFAANTSIKLAGGVSAKDARIFAPMLQCDAGFIESRQKGSFAAHVRGVTAQAVSLSFPFGHLEARPQSSAEERAALRQAMRDRYAASYRNQQPEAAPEPPKPPDPDVDTTAGSQW